MADKRISQLIERTDILNNDVLPIVASGATTTNKVTISTIQEWMQENLDVGVTSVGITIGSTGTDVNVTGSPITTSGNITINIPTASATNRGLLSAADWSTFNGKQNSITLTTSGTSGAATLVGSTLNIPNYSTGVANAYVPYVGAIGSVSLGYNALSASQINIDGASPTGGSYLGFKHSTSVNTGTDGYTSMYTFGTNTIGFQSTSGGTSKAFAFSMVGITAGVPGGRQYTLPDASGTLALTSDLSGYVTLGTAQTITAQKTFTTSGGDDTLIVNHTSGSGIAVDISKAGNGEGLRVIKTSGTGNAVTISGGLLLAEAATLTGALNGTSASFTGGVTSTGAKSQFVANGGDSAGAGISLNTTLTTNPTLRRNWGIFTEDQIEGDFAIKCSTAAGGNANTGNRHFFMTSTGAATFSSSVTAGAIISTGVSTFSRAGLQMTVNPSYGGGDVYSQIQSTGALALASGGDNNRLYITSSGNVGIGTASPEARLDVKDASAGGSIGMFIENTAASTLNNSADIYFGTWGGSSIAGITNARIQALNVNAGNAATDLLFHTYSGSASTERMRITSGGALLLGTQSGSGIPTGSSVNQGVDISGGVISIQTNNNANNYWSKASGFTSGDFTAHFVNGSYVGGISTNGSTTTYAVASDYRLKEDFQEINGLEKVQAIKVYDYKWKNSEDRMDGVIAHELQEVLPYAVVGEKDAERMQSVDYSKIVPILIKAIQELTEQVEALKSQING